MQKKIILLLVLLFLGVVLSGCVEERPLQYIIVSTEGKGTYQSIQEAIDNATAGDTIIVHSGIYYEHIILNKSIVLKGDGKDTTVINYNSSKSGSIILIEADNCSIQGFSIINTYNGSVPIGFIIGIKITSNKNLILNNTISHTSYGIKAASKTQDNTISQNFIRNNKNGIEIWHSSRNDILHNNISNNSQFGILIGYESPQNEVRYNTLFNNTEPIRIKDSEHNVVTNNILIKNTREIIECCGARYNKISNNTYK
jgi:parallel beta-helix repeat protein